jgi:hypothetical protein
VGAATKARQGKRFFFAKKNQKTFILQRVGTLTRRKSFCLFFKKEALP